MARGKGDGRGRTLDTGGRRRGRRGSEVCSSVAGKPCVIAKGTRELWPVREATHCGLLALSFPPNTVCRSPVAPHGRGRDEQAGFAALRSLLAPRGAGSFHRRPPPIDCPSRQICDGWRTQQLSRTTCLFSSLSATAFGWRRGSLLEHNALVVLSIVSPTFFFLFLFFFFGRQIFFFPLFSSFEKVKTAPRFFSLPSGLISIVEITGGEKAAAKLCVLGNPLAWRVKHCQCFTGAATLRMATSGP